MCLVVQSSERFELRAYSGTEKDKAEIERGIDETMMMKKRDGCISSRAEAEEVRWERVLPRMMLRVMLVEADDSTRQIIVALLRRCSYNVVAVPDGLKAWEILKGKPHDIDLILTEVDLPSISGFALLTLITEHEMCKSIPVIMMSSQDSISTVYKCMMRGAADYLVKPIRRNELTNMWQHVWRRRQSSTENGLIDPQEKIEGTSENHVASSHSNCYMECNQRNKEQLDKGNDAQSSCTKQDLEVNHVHMGGDMQESSSDVGMPKHTACINFGILNGSETKDANMTSVGCDNNDPIANCTDSTDLLGAFNSHPICCHRIISLSNGASKFDSSPHLDLSLSGSSSSGIQNHFIEKRATLGHSNASAFTQYINKPLQPLSTAAYASDQEKECRRNAEKYIDDVVTGYSYISGTLGSALNMQKGKITRASDQSYPSEIAPSCPQKRAFTIPVPLSVKGTSYNSTYMGYNTVLPPIFPSQLLENNKSEQLYEQFCQKGNVIRDQTLEKLEQKVDCMEDKRKISSATDKSGSGGGSSSSSSLCNGTGSQINSIGGYRSACVSSSNIDHVAIGQSASANKNQENFVALEGISHWSIQREAALRKFRMKRKDRCFEKKVRYESRKKLADQRPRVKGQFVRRQGQADALLVAETDGNMTND